MEEKLVTDKELLVILLIEILIFLYYQLLIWLGYPMYPIRLIDFIAIFGILILGNIIRKKI